MTNFIKIAEQNLLAPAGISDQQLQTILSTVLGRSIDQADLYFQSSYAESLVLEEGIIKSGSYHIDKGVGIRAISGEKTGFAYSDDIFISSLEQAASAARSISKQGGQIAITKWCKKEGNELYLPLNPLTSLKPLDKAALLTKIDKFARQLDSRIIEVTVGLFAEYEIILILNSEGEMAADIRPLIRLNVSVVACQNNRFEQGSAGGGGRYDYQYFIENELGEHYAKEAVRQAIVNLNAIDAPAGLMPVVLGPGWPGVLLHEAIGHGLEGDFNRKQTSVFSGRIGERVASELCTVVDDGTLKNRRGSLNIDDEGTKTQCTVLIEKGILRNYLQDKHNARLMGMQSTGNGRRESYAHLPMPRMTNTYLLAGQSHPDEIIASVKKGLYAVNFGGGQVDITSGKFVFSASEAYLIENGKITAPVKGATIVGNGPDILTKVSMVGNDLKLDEGVGVCGKDGQSVPVGVGQPTLLINSMTVGGTKVME